MFYKNDIVILDKGRSTECQVVVIYAGKLFCMVANIKNKNATWEVMTNRLSKISENNLGI